MVEILEAIANAFAICAAVVALLTVPYQLLALFRHEGSRRIKYVRRNPEAHYWPSLTSLTWLTRATAFGTTVLLLNYGVRIYLRVDPASLDLAPQPAWSYLLSMFSSSVLLPILVLPSVFLMWIKHEVMRDDDASSASSVLGAIAADTNTRVREIQERGQADRPEEKADREEGREHRKPEAKEGP